MTHATRPASLPGDLSPAEQIDRFVRVDHAGEYGATRIYAGQIAVLGRGRHGPTLSHMLEQEQVHRATFEDMIRKRRVRRSSSTPRSTYGNAWMWSVMRDHHSMFSFGVRGPMSWNRAARSGRRS